MEIWPFPPEVDVLYLTYNDNLWLEPLSYYRTDRETLELRGRNMFCIYSFYLSNIFYVYTYLFDDNIFNFTEQPNDKEHSIPLSKIVF